MGSPNERPEGLTDSDLRGAGGSGTDQVRGADRPGEIFPPATLEAIGVDTARTLLSMPGTLEGMIRESDVPRLVSAQFLARLAELPPEALAVIARDPQAVLEQIVRSCVGGSQHAAYSAGSVADATARGERIREVFGNVDTSGVEYQC